MNDIVPGERAGSTAPAPEPTEAPKPTNPEPTAAPANPEKGSESGPEPGRSEHPKQ